MGELVRWLGHDAIIFPGNSGGPLGQMRMDLLSELMKWASAAWAEQFRPTLRRSVSKELAENGFIARCWTGLECQPVLDPNEVGLLVAGIIENSPAEDAGLKPGDIIKVYDGQKVMARIAEDLPIFNQLAYGMKINKKVKISGLRNKKRMTWTLTTKSSGICLRSGKGVKKLGINDPKLHINVLPRSSSLFQKRCAGPLCGAWRPFEQCKTRLGSQGCHHLD